MSIIDKVAMALHDEWNGVGGWSSLTDAERKRWRFMAYAALEAMGFDNHKRPDAC
jgi:hypothetical protein